jgi:hypothetical protein
MRSDMSLLDGFPAFPACHPLRAGLYPGKVELLRRSKAVSRLAATLGENAKADAGCTPYG